MIQAAVLLAPFFQNDDGAAGLFGGFFGACCGLIFALLIIAGIWKVFTKAGKPGWASIIPFYNIWVMLEIVGRPGWWLILFFIPFVNILVGWLLFLELASAFGKSLVFGILMIFFPYIFMLILGFGDDQYVGPKPIL